MVEFTIAVVSSNQKKIIDIEQILDGLFLVDFYGSGQDLLAALSEHPAQLVLIDFDLADHSGPALQHEIQSSYPGVYTAMITAIDRSKCAIASMKRRAMDYIYYDEDPDRFTDNICKLVRFIIEEKKRKAIERVLHDTGLEHFLDGKYEDRSISMEEIKKAIQNMKKPED